MTAPEPGTPTVGHDADNRVRNGIANQGQHYGRTDERIGETNDLVVVNRNEETKKGVEYRLSDGAYAVRCFAEGEFPTDGGQDEEALVSVAAGEMGLREMKRWRLDLEWRFKRAQQARKVTPQPDVSRVNEFLIELRQTCWKDALEAS